MKTVLQRFSLRTVDDPYERRGLGIKEMCLPNFLNICCSSSATERPARDLIACTMVVVTNLVGNVRSRWVERNTENCRHPINLNLIHRTSCCQDYIVLNQSSIPTPKIKQALVVESLFGEISAYSTAWPCGL